MGNGSVIRRVANSTLLENQRPRNAKARQGGGPYIRPRPGNWMDVTVASFPQLRPSVK